MLIFDMATKKQIEFAEKINAIPSKPFTCQPLKSDPKAAEIDLRIEVTLSPCDQNQAIHLAKKLRQITGVGFETAGRSAGEKITHVVYHIPVPDYGSSRLRRLEKAITDNLGSINQHIAKAAAGGPIVTSNYPAQKPKETKAIEPRAKETPGAKTPSDYLKRRNDLPRGLG